MVKYLMVFFVCCTGCGDFPERRCSYSQKPCGNTCIYEKRTCDPKKPSVYNFATGEFAVGEEESTIP